MKLKQKYQNWFKTFPQNVFSCFSQSQPVSAVSGFARKQRIPTVIG